jgi:hypothetical protein
MTQQPHAVASATAGVGSAQKDTHHDMETTTIEMYSAFQEDIKHLREEIKHSMRDFNKRLIEEVRTVKKDVKSLLHIIDWVDGGEDWTGGMVERSCPSVLMMTVPGDAPPPRASATTAKVHRNLGVGEKSMNQLKPSSMRGMSHRDGFSISRSDVVLLT